MYYVCEEVPIVVKTVLQLLQQGPLHIHKNKHKALNSTHM
jgi:hypothetical protein